MTTPQSLDLTRILLIDDEEHTFKNLAEALGYSPPIRNVQRCRRELPSGSSLDLSKVLIRRASGVSDVELTWLRTPVTPIKNLIDFLVMSGRDYHLIAYDLAWGKNDPINSEDIKEMKARASIVWRLRSELAGPGAFVLYQLQDTHDPGREILSRLVLYSYHIESEGHFIPSPRLWKHMTDQSDEQTQPNALGDEFLGHLDFLGLIGKSSDLGKVGLSVGKALEFASKVRPTAITRPLSGSGLIGRQFNELLKQKKLDTITSCNSTVLIRGETGTGKEGVARAIHGLSDRCDKPFVAINCGALSESLLESELFGHAKGAFTGAESEKKGKFEAADGGVIFLDEINSASLGLQVKLLRVLQEREFEPVGSVITKSVDVVVIVASNTSLEDLITKGQFRQDLFYRLNVIPIELPPLRERADDIPDLAEFFLNEFNRMLRKTAAVQLDPKATEVMVQYSWPGNVRELKTCVERCAFYCTNGRITANDVLAFVADEKKRWSSIRSSAAEPQLPEPPRSITPKQLRDWIVGVARVHSVLIAKQHGKTLLENGWSDIETGTRKNWLELLNQIDTASAEDFENQFFSKTKARNKARGKSSD